MVIFFESLKINLIVFLKSWDSFFRNCEQGIAYQSPPSLAPLRKNEIPARSLLPALNNLNVTTSDSNLNEKLIDDHLAVQAIIRSYQVIANNIIESFLFL